MMRRTVAGSGFPGIGALLLLALHPALPHVGGVGGQAESSWQAAPMAESQSVRALAARVEIRRTEYGVPHILGEDLESAYFGLGWVQSEDYGPRVVRGLIAARGEMGRTFGPDSVPGDFQAKLNHRRAQETWHLLDPDTRAAYRGFATAVNLYVELHPAEFPYPVPSFSGIDGHARDLGRPSGGEIRKVVDRLVAMESGQDPAADSGNAEADGEGDPSPFAPDDGSNAWAIAPSRSASGNAILLRNPHLSWDAGYYEGHITVPGVLNYYGDFRLGGPFGIIGGFNERLGWATTNNYPDQEEIYALSAAPGAPDHYLWDGAAVPLRREVVTIDVRNGSGMGTATEEFWFTVLGPVVHRGDGKIYTVKATSDGEYRVGQQFLAMMRAGSLEDWKNAMRMQARGSSNLTYADADGNIFYVWNANVAALPHAPGGDSLAIPAAGPDDVWSALVPWDDLPQVLNPEQGFLHQENDPFHYTTPWDPMDPADFPANFPAPNLRLRSQHAVSLLEGTERFTLDELVERKHSMGMLLADRVKSDLVAAVEQWIADPPPAPFDTCPCDGEAETGPAHPDAVAEALDVVRRWDNTVAADARGAVLFEAWYLRHGRDVGFDEMFAEPWTAERALETPAGLARPADAADAFARAINDVTSRWGAADVAWGEVHRVRIGDVDVPVGGCTGVYGCFRVLWFDEDADGRRSVRGGDGWVLFVEFGDQPRGYSVLAYGESDNPESRHFNDQAALFAENGMKVIRFREADVQQATVRRYHPGEGH